MPKDFLQHQGREPAALSKKFKSFWLPSSSGEEASIATMLVTFHSKHYIYSIARVDFWFVEFRNENIAGLQNDIPEFK